MVSFGGAEVAAFGGAEAVLSVLSFDDDVVSVLSVLSFGGAEVAR